MNLGFTPYRMHARTLLLTAIAAVLAACSDSQEPPTYLQGTGGDAANGRRLIAAYGCGTCHSIEGVRGARGTVGPPLHDYAQRTLLAGILPNTPRILVAWLVDPVALDPQTGMPAMGVSEAEARDMAAYLHSLGASRTRIYPPDPPLPLRGYEKPVLQARGQPVHGPNRADTTPGSGVIERGSALPAAP